MTVVEDVIGMMERIAPAVLAEAWDNPGLQLGDPRSPVKSIMAALDPTYDAVQAACDQNVDLLITHHPLFFRSINKIDLDTPIGKIIHLAIRHQLAIFSAHTNLDSVAGGLNDIFASRLGLKDLRVLSPLSVSDVDNGLGRIGRLDGPIDLNGLAQDVKKKLGLKGVYVSGAYDLQIEKVAVCTGSGSGLMANFLRSDAQVFISGDLKYHDARDAQMQNRGLIDIGHFASEQFMVEMVRDRLEKMLEESGRAVGVVAWARDSDPFRYV